MNEALKVASVGIITAVIAVALYINFGSYFYFAVLAVVAGYMLCLYIKNNKIKITAEQKKYFNKYFRICAILMFLDFAATVLLVKKTGVQYEMNPLANLLYNNAGIFGFIILFLCFLYALYFMLMLIYKSLLINAKALSMLHMFYVIYAVYCLVLLNNGYGLWLVMS